MIQSSLLRSGVVAALLLMAAAPASAFSTYTFTFSNVDGAVAGTVTGTIQLPDGDGTFPAVGVEIASAPGLLGLTLPLDAMSSGSLINSFLVVGGQIDLSGSVFLAQFATGTSLGIQGGPGGETFLDLSGADDLGASGVLDTASATLVVNAVPEASAGWAVASVGAAAAGYVCWRRRKAGVES